MWDRHAIEHALDKIAGLDQASNDSETEVDRWFKEHGGEGPA
jgi:hypothetical protein